VGEAQILRWRAIGLVLAAVLAGAMGAISCDEATFYGPPAPDDASPGPTGESDASDASGASDGARGDAGERPTISVMVEPGDRAGALLSAVQGATKSVHVTMYLLTYAPFIDALVAQKKDAHHEVKVLLNANFPDGTNGNQSAHDQLTAAGVDVAWAPSTFVYTHEKCIIIDGATAWIMTMNLTYSATTSNREFLVIDRDATDVTEAESIFEADFANQAATVAGPLVVAPVNASDSLLALAAAATTTLDVEGETFSDRDMTGSLVAAKNRGVAVRVVLSDAAPTPAQRDAVTTLKNASIPVVSVSSPYIHAKAMVADGAQAYVGSENFTYNSLHSNRELGVILTTPSEVTRVSTAIQADFAQGTPL